MEEKYCHRIKELDKWKENYGYSDCEDVSMLEDLQSRAFQREDDTEIINQLLYFFNISDENQLLAQVKSQNQKIIDCLKIIKEQPIHFYVNDKPELTGYYINVEEIQKIIGENAQGQGGND
jgi:hypothetical protein